MNNNLIKYKFNFESYNIWPLTKDHIYRNKADQSSRQGRNRSIIESIMRFCNGTYQGQSKPYTFPSKLAF